MSAAGAEPQPTAARASRRAGGHAYLSIGEVLTQLRTDFPEALASPATW